MGSYVFAGCTSLKDIIIPDTVKTIGERAFEGCTSLKKAVIKGGSEDIGGHIFSKCTALEELTLPFAGFVLNDINSASVTWLGDMFGDSAEKSDKTYSISGFNGETRNIPKSLETINITGGTVIPAYTFDGFLSVKKISVPDSVTFIGDSAFSECSKLSSFKMPGKLISIGNNAFQHCSLLDTDIPEAVVSIGDYAFTGCESIKEINIPMATKTIGSYAFSGCTSLKKAVIGEGTENISDFVFNDCTALEEFTLPFAGFQRKAVDDGDISWLGYLFLDGKKEMIYSVQGFDAAVLNIPKSLTSITVTGGKKIPAYTFDGFSSVKKITVPDDIEVIEEAAFSGCTSLADFKIPSKVTSIGEYAFYDCKKLNADIPDGVRSIGARAFAGCESVKEINVPASTETIGACAFEGCISLKKATIKGGSKGIEDHIFNRCTALEELTVPFAGFSDKDINGESNIWLGDMFLDRTEGTYEASGFNGEVRYIPESLKTITVSGGKYLPNYAFDGFAKVEDITLPKTVVQIGENTFAGCKDILNVFYPDSEKAWKSVTVNEGNESIDGKINVLNSEGKYVALNASTTTTTTTTTTSKATTTTSKPTTTTTSKTTTTTSKSTTTTTSKATITTSKPTTTTTSKTTTTTSKPTTTTTSKATTTTSKPTTTTTSKVTTTTLTSAATTTTVTTKPEEYVLGDVNDDKRTDSVDASMILKQYALLSTGSGNFTDKQKKAADVNTDGLIDAVDASNILAYYTYLSTTDDEKPVGISEFRKQRTNKK